jgi:hypothetical protein
MVLGLLSNNLLEAFYLSEATKDYCEVQQEFQIWAFSLKAMGEIACMQRDVTGPEKHFEEALKFCEDEGIIPSLLYRCALLI